MLFMWLVLLPLYPGLSFLLFNKDFLLSKKKKKNVVHVILKWILILKFCFSDDNLTFVVFLYNQYWQLRGLSGEYGVGSLEGWDFFFLRKSGYIKAYMIIICTIIIVNKQMKICLVLNPQIYVIWFVKMFLCCFDSRDVSIL